MLANIIPFKEQPKKCLQPVFRKGKSLRNLLFKHKAIGMEDLESPTTRCREVGVRTLGRRCDGCNMMANISSTTLGPNNLMLQLGGGNCKSKNIIYLCQYSLCDKFYFGKTIQTLANRISGHRGKMKDIEKVVEVDDKNTLAVHAYFVHIIKTNEEFNKLYKFSVVVHLNPSSLQTSEQHYINKFQSFVPFGLNVDNPAGLQAILIN